MRLCNNIQFRLARTWFMTAICLVLMVLALPTSAQTSKDVEKVAKKNEELRQKIKVLKDDTALLEQRITENKRRLQQRTDSLNSLKAQNETYSEEQINALRQEVERLEAANTKLQAEHDGLSKVVKDKLSELEGLNIKMKDNRVYSDIQQKQQYDQNQILFSKRFSALGSEQVSDLVAHVADFQKMEGYAEYEKRVGWLKQTKDLYDECVEMLNSRYDGGRVQSLRDRLLPLRENKENKQKGIYKLNTEQYNEMDSLDIRLSRYAGGVRELQRAIESMWRDADVKRYMQEGKDRQALIKAMRKHLVDALEVRQKDWKNQSVKERYLNMLPYLNQLYKDYLHELNDNPFRTPNVEKEILSIQLVN